MMLTPEVPDEALARIFDANDISLSNRLGVYRNNVMSGLCNALTANFPLLEKLAGKDFLNSMARAYALVNPPASGCLTFYGDDFDKFVADFAPAAQMSYLPDVARLEILINRAYHAKDDEALGAQDLAEIPPDRLENLELKLRDSVHLLKSSWPLHKIRAFCLDEKQDAPDIHSGGVWLLVHRPHLNVEVVEISEGEYEFLNGLKTKSLGDAVAYNLNLYPDFDFENSLQRFMKLQLFLKPGKK